MSIFDKRTDTEKEIDIYNQNKNNNTSQQANKKSCTGAAIMILWFIVSIIAMVCLSDVSTEWTIIIFGQMFLVFGIIGLFSGGFEMSKVWILLFPLVGLGCIVGGLIGLYGEEEFKEKMYDMLPIFISVLLFVIGILFIIIPIYMKKVREKYCTLPVKGVIADVYRKRSSDRNHHNIHYVYAPVYEYFYNGTLYRKESNVYTNYEKFDIGSEVTVFLNPSNPDDYYVKRSGETAINLIFGIIFLIFSVAIMLFYIMG